MVDVVGWGAEDADTIVDNVFGLVHRDRSRKVLAQSDAGRNSTLRSTHKVPIWSGDNLREGPSVVAQGMLPDPKRFAIRGGESWTSVIDRSRHEAPAVFGSGAGKLPVPRNSTQFPAPLPANVLAVPVAGRPLALPDIPT